MNLDIKTLLDELSIHYSTSSKHATTGRLQLTCPYCGDTADHLGYHIQKEYFNCWKCGWHPLVETIAALGNISKWEAAKAIELHRTGRPFSELETDTETKKPKEIEFPFGTGQLQPQHWKYLYRRGFTKKYIKTHQPKYNILATGPVGDYKLRLLFPITHYGKLVSYQCRDITEKALHKYKACNAKNEIYPHKKCLYGADHAKENSVVVTEGILDALKLGPGAVCTFGTAYSWAQVKQLADRWTKRYIFFDRDKAGQTAAKKLASALSLCKGNTYIISPDTVHDAGEMSLEQTYSFMKRFKIRR